MPSHRRAELAREGGGGYDDPHFVNEEMVAKTQTLCMYEEGRKKEEKEWVC